MKQLRIGECNFHVYDAGQGAPVLFVHGFPLDHSMWQPQLEALQSEFRVIAPDLRGFGRSDPTSGVVTMEQFADDLYQILDSLDIESPVHFCGLSMGGYIAFEFARKYAQRLKSLILCDTRSAADSPEIAGMRRKLVASVQTVGVGPVVSAMLPKLFSQSTLDNRSEIVEQVRSTVLNTSPKGMVAAALGMAERRDSTDMLPTLNLPALLIVGAEDAISPVEEMRGMSAAMPRAEFVVIPDSGHMTPLENPAAVNEALRQFLAQ